MVMTRKFNGKTFKLVGGHHIKRHAQRHAAFIREENGGSARVVKHLNNYRVYAHYGKRR